MRPEGVFIRNWASTTNAPESMILQMIKDNTINYEETISFDQSLTFDYAISKFNKINIKLEKEQMKTLNFFTNDKYNNLALLLSEQCKQTIKVAIFQGTNKEFLETEMNLAILYLNN